jgi:hypothetical protein
MTRGIFDPTGGNTERSGSTFLGPEGAQASHLPSDVTDGEVRGENEATLEGVDRADDTPAPFTPDADEAARRLGEMTNPRPDPEA